MLNMKCLCASTNIANLKHQFSIFYFVSLYKEKKKGGFLCSARHHFAPFFLFVESDNSHTVLQRTKLLRLLLP